MLPLVRGLLGLDGDAIGKVVTFAPQVPADWDSLVVTGYRVGAAEFSFRYRRSAAHISVTCTASNAEVYHARIELPVPTAAGWMKASIDGKPTNYAMTQYASVQGLSIELDNPSGAVVELEYEPVVELLPPEVSTTTGDANKGLKIISSRSEKRNLVVTVEGLSGTRYSVGLRNAHTVEPTQGCVLQGESLVIEMPKGKISALSFFKCFPAFFKRKIRDT